MIEATLQVLPTDSKVFRVFSIGNRGDQSIDVPPR